MPSDIAGRETPCRYARAPAHPPPHRISNPAHSREYNRTMTSRRLRLVLMAALAAACLTMLGLTLWP
ncbi:hypothetical protein [Agrococcus casei]|uniref:hypothetical protein n=1 Tax=Agrococcus casei TaxID=343512 RepID=UPI003F903957